MHACLCDSVRSAGLAGLVEAGYSVKMRRDMRFLTPFSPHKAGMLYIIHPPCLCSLKLSAFPLMAFNGALDFSPLVAHLFFLTFSLFFLVHVRDVIDKVYELGVESSGRADASS